MDRNTILIIVVAIALIGGWALMNFVLFPEPKVTQLDVLLGDEYVMKKGAFQDPKVAEFDEERGVIRVASTYADKPLRIVYKTEAVKSLKVLIDNKEMAVRTGAEAASGN